MFTKISAANAKAAQTKPNVLLKLKSSLQKIYGHHHKLADRYEISISQLKIDLFFSLSLTRLLPTLTI